MRFRNGRPAAAAALIGLAAVVAPPPAQAGTVYVDPVSYGAAAISSPAIGGGWVVCTSSSPCPSSGPSSATAELLLPLSSSNQIWSGSAIATVGGLSAPAVSATAALSAAQLIEGSTSPQTMSAGASITYYFDLTQVAGTAFSGPVPVLLNGSSSIKTKIQGVGTTTMTVSATVTAVGDTTPLYSLPGSNDGPFFQSLAIIPNLEYQVTLGAYASSSVSASSNGSPSLSALASIDPTLVISPDYANDFQLSLSSGIDNGSAVPEPSSLAAMAIGLATLAATKKFRRPHARS